MTPSTGVLVIRRGDIGYIVKNIFFHYFFFLKKQTIWVWSDGRIDGSNLIFRVITQNFRKWHTILQEQLSPILLNFHKQKYELHSHEKMLMVIFFSEQWCCNEVHILLRSVARSEWCCLWSYGFVFM